MTPTAKFAVKCSGFGVYASLTYLASAQANGSIDVNTLVSALIAGGIGGLGYAGIGATTSLEAPGKK